MERLRQQYGASERRACRVLGVSRNGIRRKPVPREKERRLIEAILELTKSHPRYGYRRIWALLRMDGWRVNLKRVYRLWRAEGLKVPRRKRRWRAIGEDAKACDKRPTCHKNDVWTWDFIHDRTVDGRPLKWLSIVDEHTRECLALEVGRTLNGRRVIEALERLVPQRGAPRRLRSDNGPEYIAAAVRQWLDSQAVEVMYVAPGSPWQNGFAESFHSRVRDELSNVEEFVSLLEARVVGAEWKEEYNHRRPHSSLGYSTPAEFSARSSSSGTTLSAIAANASPPEQDLDSPRGEEKP